MTAGPPLTAAGSRQPEKAPPISAKVREAVRLMVFGRDDDENCTPLDFIEAGRIAGVKPDVMRRHLDRPNVRALLLSERRAFRNAINAGNELALKNIRDTAANSMARIGAIRTLEELGDEDAARHSRPSNQTPGVRIIIERAAPVDPASFDAPAPMRTIAVPFEARTLPVPVPPEPPGDPIFKAPEPFFRRRW